jgi:hypothetical protein
MVPNDLCDEHFLSETVQRMGKGCDWRSSSSNAIGSPASRPAGQKRPRVKPLAPMSRFILARAAGIMICCVLLPIQRGGIFQKTAAAEFAIPVRAAHWAVKTIKNISSLQQACRRFAV